MLGPGRRRHRADGGLPLRRSAPAPSGVRVGGGQGAGRRNRRCQRATALHGDGRLLRQDGEKPIHVNLLYLYTFIPSVVYQCLVHAVRLSVHI